MVKSSGPGCRAKRNPPSNPARKAKTAKCFHGTISALSVSSSFILIVSILRGSKGKEESISIKWFVFFVFTKNRLGGLYG
jgi:hypothetical protein